MAEAEAGPEDKGPQDSREVCASVTHVAAVVQDAAKIVEHLVHEDRVKVIKALGLILGIELASPY